MVDPDEGAVAAYNALLVWIRGFRKNSRNTSRPIYVWQHDDERAEFAALIDSLRAAPFVLRNNVTIGAFPIKAPPPTAAASASAASSETLSAVETVDVCSSPFVDLTAEEHRRFL